MVNVKTEFEEVPLLPETRSVVVKKEEPLDVKPPGMVKQRRSTRRLKIEKAEAEEAQPVDAKRRKAVRYFMDCVMIVRKPNARRSKPSTRGPPNSFKKDEAAPALLPLRAISPLSPPPQSPSASPASPRPEIQRENSHQLGEPDEPLQFQQPTEEENRERMKDWKNPKLKVKKEAASLSPESVMSRITAAGISFQLYPIECADRDVMVSREFMSSVYGGSSQRTFPAIRKEKIEEHGLSDFMYLPMDFQPHAPEVPGAPGLWFDLGEGVEFQSGTRRVFTRVTKNPALWQYQGQYEVRLAAGLSREEWESQKPLTRNTWANDIYKKKYGAEIRAEIYGIKHLGWVPTSSERKQILDSGLWREIDQAGIALALKLGQIPIAVYTMKCVGYDKAFQTAVARRWETYVPRPRKQKVQAGSKRTAQDEPRSTKAERKAAKRRKLEEDVVDVDELLSDADSDEDEDELEYESEGESDNDEVQEVMYSPRGTRSRPGRL